MSTNYESNTEETITEEYVDLNAEPAEQANPETPAPTEVANETVETEELPEKYRGKSPLEIARMHQEAEKLMGRQSSEVGELRKIVDDFVNAQLVNQQSQAQQAAVEPEEEIDFFDDPQKAIDAAITRHPKVKEAEQLQASLRQQNAVAALKAKHPDYEAIVADQSFMGWVEESPFRSRLLREADQNFDTDAADELFSAWKERNAAIKATAEADKSQRQEAVNKASTGGTGGSTEKRSRKVYRRADIIKLMQSDPARYSALASEIRQAYAEGRVK